ncbi:uncharacterized protein [Nicotiana sylvestris]|uniref:uncharacterized protein n=1 Tax=Nicotiana sylvestris TaxID=4096 RepID=UPI00388C7AEF
MVCAKETILLFSAMAIFGFFSTTLVDGTVYSVGDSAGWTGSNIDYHMWASTKTFQVGDTLGCHSLLLLFPLSLLSFWSSLLILLVSTISFHPFRAKGLSETTSLPSQIV